MMRNFVASTRPRTLSDDRLVPAFYIDVDEKAEKEPEGGGFDEGFDEGLAGGMDERFDDAGQMTVEDFFGHIK